MDSNEFVHQLEISKLTELQIILATAILDDAGVAAIEEIDNGLIIYHHDEAYIIDKKTLLLGAFDWLNSEQIHTSTIPNENWNKKWESSFAPLVIEDLCTVKASFHNINIETPYAITINPELAFGTGHHETTYQMMVAMRELDFRKKCVLDYGCGTGILAILAEMLGAQEIDAIDYDAQAIDCAQDCLLLNNAKNTNLFVGELGLLHQKRYDIVLANINRKVLLESGDALYKMISSDGVLLLSGILDSDFEIIQNSYQSAGFILTHHSQKGEWLCLKLMKK